MDERVALRLPRAVVEQVKLYHAAQLRKRPGSTMKLSDAFRELIALGLARAGEDGTVPREPPP